MEGRRSRGSFRPRPIDLDRPLLIIRSDGDLEIQEECNFGNIPLTLMGMDATEQEEFHLQQAIKASISSTSRNKKEAEIPIPDVKQVQDYESRLRPWNRTREYATCKEFTEQEELEKEVFYELDDEDIAWVSNYNHGKSAKQMLTEDDLERSLDRLDKEYSRVKIEDGAFPAGTEKVLHLPKNAALTIVQYYVEKRQRRKDKALLRQHRPPPDINDPNPALTFRPREKERPVVQRKQLRRRDDNLTFERLRRMRLEFERARMILELINKREKLKREVFSCHMDLVKSELAQLPKMANMVDPEARFSRDATQRRLSLKIKIDDQTVSVNGVTARRERGAWDETWSGGSEDEAPGAESEDSDDLFLPTGDFDELRRKKNRKKRRRDSNFAIMDRAAEDYELEYEDTAGAETTTDYAPPRLTHYACGPFHGPRIFSGSHPRFLRYPRGLRPHARARLVDVYSDLNEFVKVEPPSGYDPKLSRLFVRGRVGRGGRVLLDIPRRNCTTLGAHPTPVPVRGKRAFIDLEMATQGGFRWENEADPPSDAEYDNLKYLFNEREGTDQDVYLSNYPRFDYDSLPPSSPPPVDPIFARKPPVVNPPGSSNPTSSTNPSSSADTPLTAGTQATNTSMFFAPLYTPLSPNSLFSSVFNSTNLTLLDDDQLMLSASGASLDSSQTLSESSSSTLTSSLSTHPLAILSNTSSSATSVSSSPAAPQPTTSTMSGLSSSPVTPLGKSSLDQLQNSPGVSLSASGAAAPANSELLSGSASGPMGPGSSSVGAPIPMEVDSQSSNSDSSSFTLTMNPASSNL